MRLNVKHMIAYFFIITLIATGVSFSRFSTVLMNTGAQNADLPSIEFSTWELSCDAAFVNLGPMKPGDVRYVEVAVRNYEGGKVSGYDQDVWLEVVHTKNLPLTFDLKRAGSSINLLPGGLTDGFYSLIGDRVTFRGSVGEEKKFTFQITWPGNIDSDRYKDEVDYLEIRLQAKQR